MNFSKFSALFGAATLLYGCANAQTTTQFASGVVFHDKNNNRKRDANEKGLPNVAVSNQRDIVRTDAEGRYRLAVTDDTALFVVKPRGWMTPLDKNKLPQFYYLHKPNGSPKSKYPGVAPTGPLPASVDFPLTPQNEPDQFRALLFGDPQPRNEQEIDYIYRDVVQELIGIKAAFGVSLGDVVFNDLSLYPSLNSKIALIGIPWYNVIGNHDLNFDSPDDDHSDETFEKHFGPNYYSFDYGPTHFMVLDDVTWLGAVPGGTGAQFGGKYRGGLGAQQLAWIKNDLAQIPADQMVVLFMHIPLVDPADINKKARPEVERFHSAERKQLWELLEKRPATLSISAHTHFQEHKFVGPDEGWNGPEKHHHVINVTVSGSWWSGAPDERGIPHTTMRDGAPNGYSFLNFDGKKYWIDYRAAGRFADYQMNIYAPIQINVADSAKTEVLVNVFAGSERSKVQMKVDDGAWQPLQWAPQEDPVFRAWKAREAQEGNKVPGRALPGIIQSPHIWAGNLPPNLAPGEHTIHVQTTDLWGKTHNAQQKISVR
jgi:hypothetical protein